MEFRDLHRFPDSHLPSPYARPVLVVKVGDGVLPKGLRLQAVGWLERSGFPTGTVPKSCIDALVAALRGGIFMDGTRGIHTCTMCGEFPSTVKWRRRSVGLPGHGHYLVQLDKFVYMAPSLLLHYILVHEYRPPDEFLQAVTDGRFLNQDDLIVTWRSHDEKEPI